MTTQVQGHRDEPAPAAGEPLSFICRRWVSLFVVGLAAVLAWGLNLLLSDAGRRWFMNEWGPVENAGIVLYLVVIVLLVPRLRDDRAFFFHTLLLVVLMTARELDIQTAFTSKSFINKNFFRHGAEGFSLEQVGGILAWIIGGGIALSYLRYTPRFLAGLKRGSPCAVSIAVMIAAVVVSNLLDGAYRVLHNEWGLPFPVGAKNFVSSFEELLEAGIPAILILALVQYRACFKRS